LDGLKARLANLIEIYEQLIPTVTDTKDSDYIDFQARRLVECAGHITLGYLLLLDTNRFPEEFKHSAEVYINYGEAEVQKIRSFIDGFNIDGLGYYKQVSSEK
jgi:hypothetical protein